MRGTRLHRELGARELAERRAARSTSSRRCGGTAAARCCASWSTPTPSSCSAGRWRTRSSRCSIRGCASSRCARAWPTPSSGWHHTPTGIWAPECGYAPGMEPDYAAAGVGHFMVDGPSLHGDTALGRPVGDSDVVAFGRDLQVSYRVWSPKSGYPGHAAYRDFHTYDHVTGLKPARVTGRNVRLGRQGAVRPRARRPRRRQARRRLRRDGARAAASSRANASAGPRTWSPRSTPNCSGTGGTRARSGWSGCCARCPRPACGSARSSDADRRRIRRRRRSNLPPSSWGSGKDWRVWAGEQVADLVQLNTEVVDTALSTVDKALGPTTRRRAPGTARLRRRPDPARDAADGVERLGVHGQQGLRRRLRPLPRAPARPRHPGDRRRAGVGPPRAGRAAGRRLEPRRRPVRRTRRRDRLPTSASMKILMVSWEYPPVVVGGLGRHVHHLATALAAAGHEVVVLAGAPPGTDPQHPPDHRRGRRGRAGGRRGRGPARVRLRRGHDGVDAGDGARDGPRRAGADKPGSRPGLAARRRARARLAGRAPGDRAGRILRRATGFHASTPPRPAGTAAGCRDAISRQVHAVESWLVRESDSLITCSASMRDEVTELFGPGLAEIPVIRNGIDADAVAVRDASAARADPPQLLYLGRLEYEKGVQDAIAALPRIRRTHPGTTLAIAGDGTQYDWLVEQARKHKVLKAVTFVGRPRPHGTASACCTAPTPSCCPAATSRSASSRWRRPRPARRWSRPPSAGWARR